VNCNGSRRAPCSACLFAVAALALAGCGTIGSDSALKASHPDARSACSAQAQPDLAFVAPGDVGMTVFAQPALANGKPRGWLVAINVAPPPKARFRFLRDTLEVAGKAGERGDLLRADATAVAVEQMPAKGWVDIAVTGPTPLEAARRAASERPEVDLASVAMHGSVEGTPQRLRVVLPAVQTARERIEPPPQELSVQPGDVGYRTLRSSDYAETLAQRTATCQAQTPKQACDGIARLDPYSFRHDSGAFTWLGRFWTQPGEPLRFEVVVQARTPQPWRIAEPVVRVTDADTGKTADSRFDDVNASIRYAVPLDTRLQGIKSGLTIALPLDAHSRYAIQLPPYVVNGQRHEMKPIELELRRIEARTRTPQC
jgi:hypothetical protein